MHEALRILKMNTMSEKCTILHKLPVAPHRGAWIETNSG